MLSLDVTQLMHASRRPCFVLNERGRLVFESASFRSTFLATSAGGDDRKRLETEFLRPPVDQPEGVFRLIRRPWGEGKHRQWWSISFLPVVGEDGFLMAHFGTVSPADEPTDAEIAVDGAAEERLTRLREAQRARWGVGSIIARSPAMQRVMDQLAMAAGVDVPVMFVGDSGSGKRSLALLLHSMSDRDGSAVVIDARALSPADQREQFLDVTHVAVRPSPTAERGAGPLRMPTDEGTLVIVGLSSLSQEVQELVVRLATADPPMPFRLLATDRLPTDQSVAEGRLIAPLHELFTRLVVQVPALRQRRDDLAELVTETLQAESGPRKSIEPDAMAAMAAYDWPGNLPELIAVVTGAMGRSDQPTIRLRDLPRRLVHQEARELPPQPAPPLPKLEEILESVERRMIGLALERWKGNKSRAAKELGISRPRLHRRAIELGLTEGKLQQKFTKPTQGDGDL